MEIILKEGITSKYRIKDFTVSPLSDEIITVGDDLIFFTKDFKVKKKLTKKINSCDLIKYIKEDNQLFASSTFYIINSTNEIYKCDSSTKKILDRVFFPSMNVNSLNVSQLGKVVYTNSSNLFTYDTLTKNINSVYIGGNQSDSNNIYIYNENILLKTRKQGEINNKVRVFRASDLTEITNFDTETNNTFLKLRGIKIYAAKDDGYIEIWDACLSELYDCKKITNSKITYIENDDEWFYIGTSAGELIVTTDKLDVVKRIKIFKSEVKKLLYSKDKIYALSQDGQLIPVILTDEDDKNVVNKFLKAYNIHADYADFFTTSRVIKIENFIKKLNIKQEKYYPQENLIFKALSTSLTDKKVCILGKDPYFQPNVATGLAFEVKKKSWTLKTVNTSLKNILKLIYYSYTNERKEIIEIREEVAMGKFRILAPDKLFKSWEKQGVLLLNTALTVLSGNAGSHIYFWNEIIRELIEYISSKNNNITFLLWGKDAQSFEKNILNGEIIKHNHPAICGKLNKENDFLNGKSFTLTKDKINWLGE
ncbi:uracil-DNA glycosylase family protein [Oceanivirga salmonicida]|uniref:uracil-DNA glycosylase family protein n=1 Tax=Oceanivirga salmonicida TaxID=1769291 RepID=UPI00083176BF|nr:uracil-DNA glycosylase family protein [Oceanivirga salmonicida]